MERIYMSERAAVARVVKEARGLPPGRPAKLDATTRAGAAQRIKSGAIREQAALHLNQSVQYIVSHLAAMSAAWILLRSSRS